MSRVRNHSHIYPNNVKFSTHASTAHTQTIHVDNNIDYMYVKGIGSSSYNVNYGEHSVSP